MTPGAVLRRRCDGTFEVDQWGLDPDIVSLFSPLLGLRWSVTVEGAARLPATGAALLLHNRRFGLSEPFVLAAGIRSAIDRFVRPVGLPDVAPVGPALRRLGGVLDRPDEVAGLLRAGQLVGVPLRRELRIGSRAGPCGRASLQAALMAGAAVHPTAVIGRESGRRWRLLVGEALPGVDGEDRNAVRECAEVARRAVQDLLGATG
ncbi:MAG: hypothetical protein WKF43_02475 [Acidimicrobiales bacterium]